MPKRRASRLTRSCSVSALQNDPALPALVQSLTPAALAQLCSRTGIADATGIMAAATAPQLVSALEVAVWKSPRPGQAEVLDRSELMEWLCIWLEVGEDFTAGALAAVPDEDLLLYLSKVVRVTTHEMWGFERSTEIEDLDRIYAPSHHESAYGPFVATAIGDEHWEAVRAALDALWRHDPERVLHLFGQLSADESMLAPQEERESANDDFAAARESARERRGHVTATGARAFLAFGDARSMDELVALRAVDLETRRHLAVIDQSVPASAPGSPPAGAVLRLTHAEHPDHVDTDRAGAAAVEHIRGRLEEAGLLDAPPQQELLTHCRTRHRLPLAEAMAHLPGEALDARARELAYLANVLLAGVALNDTAMSAAQARGAALALCNLGFETLVQRQEEPRLGDPEPGLVRLFLAGRVALRDIPVRVVQAFACALERLKAVSLLPAPEWLVAEAQSAFDDLREAVARHDLAAARDALTLMSFFFDTRSCHGAVSLMDEIPRLARSGHAGGKAPLVWIESLADLLAVAELLDGIQLKGDGWVAGVQT